MDSALPARTSAPSPEIAYSITATVKLVRGIPSSSALRSAPFVRSGNMQSRKTRRLFQSRKTVSKSEDGEIKASVAVVEWLPRGDTKAAVQEPLLLHAHNSIFPLHRHFSPLSLPFHSDVLQGALTTTSKAVAVARHI